MELIWNEQNQNAVVHEVRSDSPEITLPETVEGRKIVAVGAYCFSDRKRKETNQNGITTVNGEPCDHSAQGEFVEKITLPDAVERIENAAFFNCKKLYALEVGKRTTEIGSDVFNNCSALHKVRIRGKAGYDTIAPAHIFGLNIEGEGFRARQCFREGKVDFEAYDSIFEKACAEENDRVLVHMAMDRLMTPIGLTEKNRLRYEKYLMSVPEKIFEICLKNRKLEWLKFSVNSVLAGDKIETTVKEKALVTYVQQDWTEGAAVLLAAGRKKEGGKKARYEFE